MRPGTWLVIWGGTIAVGLAATACDYPQFHFEDGDCELGKSSMCSSGKKCSVIDVGSGETGCVNAGDRGAWERCSQDVDCVRNTWCDLRLNVCKPLCTSASDCGQGECRTAKTPAEQEIPGLRVCTAYCDPMLGHPCQSVNNVTCFYDVGEAVFDCAASKNYGKEHVCTATDCVVGLACVNIDPDYVCMPWCTPPDNFCPTTGEYCVGLNPDVFFGADNMGVCAPL